jgi:hypothetical protein
MGVLAGTVTVAVAVTGEEEVRLKVAPGVKAQLAPWMRRPMLQLRVTL